MREEMGIQIKIIMEYSSLFLRGKKKPTTPDFCCIEESVLFLLPPFCLEMHSGCEKVILFTSANIPPCLLVPCFTVVLLSCPFKTTIYMQLRIWGNQPTWSIWTTSWKQRVQQLAGVLNCSPGLDIYLKYILIGYLYLGLFCPRSSKCKK